MRRLAAGLVVMLTALAAAGCGAGTPDPEAEFQRDMASARAQARQSLPHFWESFGDPQTGEYDFSLKAAFDRRDGQAGVEEIWLHHIARAPDRIIGELASDPRHLGELRKGAIMEFQESQIVDWAFFRGDSLLGHYTTRILMPRLDQMQADWLRSLLSEDPDGAD